MVGRWFIYRAAVGAVVVRRSQTSVLLLIACRAGADNSAKTQCLSMRHHPRLLRDLFTQLHSSSSRPARKLRRPQSATLLAPAPRTACRRTGTIKLSVLVIRYLVSRPLSRLDMMDFGYTGPLGRFPEVRCNDVLLYLASKRRRLRGAEVCCNSREHVCC